MAVKKYFKRAVSVVKKAAKKRYVAKAGGLRMTQLYKDVALVKKSLNVEKKNIQSIVTSNINVGQCSVNADTGQAFYDVTPAITQGVGYDQMTGNSVKLTSMALFGQIKQMSATQHPMRIKVCLFRTVGQPQPVNTIQVSNLLFDKNPITTCTDYNSQRNVNFFKDYKIIKTQYVYLQPDPTSGELMIKDFKFIMKMSHHLKWNNNTTTLTNGQLGIAFFADSGNTSAVTASTLPNIPIQKINSGATVQFYTKFYYVDN